MNKKTYTVGILSLSAVMLFVANLLFPSSAGASFSMKDRDFSAVTAHQQQGDDCLYVMDNRSGMMLVFNYDPTHKSLAFRASKSVPDAFGPVRR
jgi:hypothetical protein